MHCLHEPCLHSGSEKLAIPTAVNGCLTGYAIADSDENRACEEAKMPFSHSNADSQPLSSELNTDIVTHPTTCGIR